MAIILAASAALLSGCVGGTTYGTGVSHEKATLDDLANMLSFRRDQPDIEYRPRADLVVPEDNELVAPIEETETASAGDWPETPEERVARIRAEAEAARGSTVEENRFSRSQKRFRSPGSVASTESAPIGEGIPNISCDPQGNVMRKCTADEISRAVRAKRQELQAGTRTGTARRYLTEPPIEYRTPSGDAPMGDEGYSEEELAKIEAERKRREREMNTWRR